MADQSTPGTNAIVVDDGAPYTIATQTGVRLGIRVHGVTLKVPLSPEAVNKLRNDLRQSLYLHQEY